MQERGRQLNIQLTEGDIFPRKDSPSQTALGQRIGFMRDQAEFLKESWKRKNRGEEGASRLREVEIIKEIASARNDVSNILHISSDQLLPIPEIVRQYNAVIKDRNRRNSEIVRTSWPKRQGKVPEGKEVSLAV